jgi:hypothetical protein
LKLIEEDGKRRETGAVNTEEALRIAVLRIPSTIHNTLKMIAKTKK